MVESDTGIQHFKKVQNFHHHFNISVDPKYTYDGITIFWPEIHH